MSMFPTLGRIAFALREAMILGMAGSILWLAFADIAVERELELDKLASAVDLRALAAALARALAVWLMSFM